jgi:hypothetical protein
MNAYTDQRKCALKKPDMNAYANRGNDAWRKSDMRAYANQGKWVYPLCGHIVARGAVSLRAPYGRRGVSGLSGQTVGGGR